MDHTTTRPDGPYFNQSWWTILQTWWTILQPVLMDHTPDLMDHTSTSPNGPYSRPDGPYSNQTWWTILQTWWTILQPVLMDHTPDLMDHTSTSPDGPYSRPDGPYTNQSWWTILQTWWTILQPDLMGRPVYSGYMESAIFRFEDTWFRTYDLTREISSRLTRNGKIRQSGLNKPGVLSYYPTCNLTAYTCPLNHSDLYSMTCGFPRTGGGADGQVEALNEKDANEDMSLAACLVITI